MDELLIEEKKYVSSKQAAKITGYAKDYIGQLCREGRVPARLVGRSWYVLESALQDHRFGASSPNEPLKAEKESESASESAWESPRYEATEVPELPVADRSKGVEEPIETKDSEDVAQRLQETWQAWFDRFEPITENTKLEYSHLAESSEETEIIEEEPAVIAEEVPNEEKEEQIPIRAIHHELYQPAPREFMPHTATESSEDIEDEYEDEPQEELAGDTRKRGLVMVLHTAGAVVALIAVSLAALGSGYLDEYALSNSQVGLIAGVGLYDK